MTLAPIRFVDGSEFYEKLSKKYVRHDYGLFILAPSGVGKTHFCNNQVKPHWIDGDELWIGAGAQPSPEEEFWNQGIDVINTVDQRSDIVTNDAKLQGFWVMGASCYWLKPDAIVIPEWDTHVAQIKHREKNNYDGGVKSNQLEQVREHIKSIQRWNINFGVPEFKSVELAVSTLTSKR
jgi:hypothetical protein